MYPMDNAKFDSYKAKLEKERSLLLAEIKQNERPVDFGADTEDMDEWTDRSEEVGNQLAMAEDLKNRLEEVNHALEKFRMGTYGVCEQCKRPIEMEVLDIDPESRLCKNCKSKR